MDTQTEDYEIEMEAIRQLKETVNLLSLRIRTLEDVIKGRRPVAERKDEQGSKGREL